MTSFGFLRRNAGCLISSRVARKYVEGCGIVTSLQENTGSYANTSFTQYRTLKSELKIKWVRPPKVPCYVPEKSGDLKRNAPLDLKNLQPEIEKTKEIQDANDLVKKVLSLEFAPKSVQGMVLRDIVVNKVKRHTLDLFSLESKIARMTVQIRRLQDHISKCRKDVHGRVLLKELIEKRRSNLNVLRMRDYKRFEWVLEKLDIEFRPKPAEMFVVTRKDSLRRLTEEYCTNVKNQRLEAYKNILNAQKVDFLQNKIEKLKWIRNEEIECGVEPTVTEAEIEMVKEQLQVLKIAKEAEERDKQQEV